MRGRGRHGNSRSFGNFLMGVLFVTLLCCTVFSKCTNGVTLPLNIIQRSLHVQHH